MPVNFAFITQATGLKCHELSTKVAPKQGFLFTNSLEPSEEKWDLKIVTKRPQIMTIVAASWLFT